MQTLFLFRHAKSDWSVQYRCDHERPLSPRGQVAARHMGQLITNSKKIPELIICSTAKRAKQTLNTSYKSGNWDSQVIYSDRLYESRADNMLDLIQQTSKTVGSVMLIGHEPTLSDLASELIGGGNLRFSTASIARIDFHCRHWSEAGSNSGQLRWLLQPRFFKYS